MESLSEAFREIGECLTKAGEQAPPGTAWKAIVKAYLNPEHCYHAEARVSVGGTCARASAGRQGNAGPDRWGADQIQDPNASVDAGASGRRQGARMFRDLFNDDRGSCTRPITAGPSCTSERARERTGLSLHSF
jgi:hypothetical protein